VTRAEKILLPVNEKQIIHPYSDQGSFNDIALPCYCLEEVIAEKSEQLEASEGLQFQETFMISTTLFQLVLISMRLSRSYLTSLR